MNAPAMPGWPRLLRKARAAAYCDLTPALFERAMSEGAVPYPVQVAGEDRWSRALLDEYIEKWTGEKAPDWRDKAKVYQRGRG